VTHDLRFGKFYAKINIKKHFYATGAIFIIKRKDHQLHIFIFRNLRR